MTEEFLYPAIHASGIREHQRCRRKWWLGDRHWGLGYRPRPSNAAAAIGTLVHDALSEHYGKGVDWVWATERAVNNWIQHAKDVGAWDSVDDAWWDETTSLARLVIDGYAIHYEMADHYLDDYKIVFVETERKFSFKVGDYTIEGIWDGIVRLGKSNQLWVFETKTTNNLARIVDGIQWDYQPQLYVAAAEKIYGEPVGGVIYNIIKRTDPFSVKTLQNGMPSTAKVERESTTVAVYQALVERGLERLPEHKQLAEEAKYMLLIEEMKQWPSPLYIRHAVTYNRDQINNVLRYVELEGHAMVGTTSLGAAVQPSFDRYTCGGCAYRWACQAMNDGNDYREILDATMVKEQEDLYGTEAHSPDDE
jgi:hypothetical protein